MNSILIQYYLRRATYSFIFSFLISTILLVLLSFVKYSDIFISTRISSVDILRIILLLFPVSMEFSVPLSMMVSLLYIVYVMNINNEILALELVGVSRFEISAPFIFLSLVAFAVNMLLSIFVFPITIQEMKEVAVKYVRVELIDSLSGNRINDEIPDTMIFFKSKNADRHFRNLYLFQKKIGDGNMLVFAKDADISPDNEKLSIDIRLENGRIMDTNKGMMRDIIYKSGTLKIDGADLIEKRVKNIRGIYGNVPNRDRDMSVFDAIYLSLINIWIAAMIILIFLNRVHSAGYLRYLLFLIFVAIYYVGFKSYHTIVENGFMSVASGCVSVIMLLVLCVIILNRLVINRWA